MYIRVFLIYSVNQTWESRAPNRKNNHKAKILNKTQGISFSKMLDFERKYEIYVILAGC